jgi:hypothetical protein
LKTRWGTGTHQGPPHFDSFKIHEVHCPNPQKYISL